MIITTSWDDGHPLDLRLAELLEKYKLRGTFYIPLKNVENPTMSISEVKMISDIMEIGGHTLNHRYLNSLSDLEALNEIQNCKIELEQMLSKEVSAFCFPGGKYKQKHIDMVCSSGFLFARTTTLFNTKIDVDNSLMHTTVQVFDHNSITLLKHCLKRKMFSELFRQKAFALHNDKFKSFAEYFLHSNNTEVFHLWGHSWEIEKRKLWADLEDVFFMLSELSDVQFMNNTEAWKYSQNRS